MKEIQRPGLQRRQWPTVWDLYWRVWSCSACISDVELSRTKRVVVVVAGMGTWFTAWLWLFYNGSLWPECSRCSGTYFSADIQLSHILSYMSDWSKFSTCAQWPVTLMKPLWSSRLLVIYFLSCMICEAYIHSYDHVRILAKCSRCSQLMRNLEIFSSSSSLAYCVLYFTTVSCCSRFSGAFFFKLSVCPCWYFPSLKFRCWRTRYCKYQLVIVVAAWL